MWFFTILIIIPPTIINGKPYNIIPHAGSTNIFTVKTPAKWRVL